MKNIHILPTHKPSKLVKRNLGLIRVADNFTKSDLDFILAEFVNIYITSDEEIKEGDWFLTPTNDLRCANIEWRITISQFIPKTDFKKIILTDNQDLIKGGVQAIDDEFLEWFVKNPSCEKVEIDSWSDDLDGIWLKKYKIIIPKQKDNQHSDFEEYMSLVEKYTSPKEESYPDIYASKEAIIESHILFAKWQQEQHDFLPGFIKQFDPKEGEIKGWTAIEFLRWLDLNRCKIVK